MHNLPRMRERGRERAVPCSCTMTMSGCCTAGILRSNSKTAGPAAAYSKCSRFSDTEGGGLDARMRV